MGSWGDGASWRYEREGSSVTAHLMETKKENEKEVRDKYKLQNVMAPVTHLFQPSFDNMNMSPQSIQF